MIRRLQRKLVAVCMTLTAVLLGVVVAASYLLSRQNLEQLATTVLIRALEEEPGRYGSSIGGDAPLPYFTVNIWEKTAYVTGGTYQNLENSETLAAILNACLARKEESGVLREYGLRYLRRDNGWYTRAAFVDLTAQQVLLRRSLISHLAVALLSLLPLLGISILMARWASAPVERAMGEHRRFLSDASHELKTPLTVILSNADLLLEGDLGDRERRWADNIRSESRQMKALVEEMLTLARADNRTETPLEETSLSDAAEECAVSFEPVSFEAGKPLQYTIAPDLTVLGDGLKLRRLISVLLDNAVKYGAGTITLTLERAGAQARLTVSNPGEPIPPETLSRLFDRFYRGDASRGEQSGFGLGLSIAQSIAREHRGTLRAESDRDTTRFIFTVPLKKKG